MKQSAKMIRYFAIEIIYTLFTGGYLFYMHKQFGMDNPYSNALFMLMVLFAVMMIWLIGPMLNRYPVMILGFLYGLYLVAQRVYYRGFQQYFRFNTAISLIREVLGVTDAAAELILFTDILPLIIWISVNIVFIILYFVWQRNIFPLVWRLPYKLASLLLLIPMWGNYQNYQAMLEDVKDEKNPLTLNETDYYIYNVIPNTNQFVEKFGLEAFLYRDGQSLFERKVFGAAERKAISAFLNSREPFKDNAMTGIFKDKRVLFVQSESLNDVAINEELTPLLYKFKTEGINFSNFDTPLLVGSTSDTEFMANLSIIPKGEGYAACHQYPYNTYLTTLASLFNQDDYWTAAYHNCYGTYYNRSVVLPNWGYQYFFDCTGMFYEDQVADSAVAERLKENYANDSKWMAYWITYSGHQEYTLDSVGVNAEDVTHIRSLYPDLSDSVVAYLAKNMDLDHALQAFYDTLKGSGNLDDVVFVVFGDHMAKGVNLNDVCLSDDCTVNPYQTDLFIYNTQITPQTVTKHATTLDLLPTIANLWGYRIDSHTVLGSDLFDDDYPGLQWTGNGLIRDDDFAYDYLAETFSELNIPEKEAKERIAHFRKMEEISLYLLRLDYFK